MNDWLKIAYFRDLEYQFNHDQLCQRWFPQAMLKKEFSDREILEVAKYRDYIKLKKIVRVLAEVENYTDAQGFERGRVNILDIGCGVGIYSVALAKLGYRVCAIDMNEEVLSEAKDKFGELPNLNFMLSDAESYLTQCDVLFNIVLMLDVLEHMESPDVICQAAHKRLVPGGIALIIVPSGYDVAELLILAPERLIRRIRRIKEAEGGPHCQKFTLAGIQKIITAAEFEYRFVSSIYTTWLPFVLLLLLGRRGLPAYLNMRVADMLPPIMTSSWLVKGVKRGNTKSRSGSNALVCKLRGGIVKKYTRQALRTFLQLRQLGLSSKKIRSAAIQGTGIAIARIARNGIAYTEPRFIAIEPTTRCNLRCTMCTLTYMTQRHPRDLTFGEFKRILDQFKDPIYVTLTGDGEPLLNRELISMIRYVRAKGCIVSFNTNGTIMNQDLAENLITSGLDRLIISMDSATPEIYEKIRSGAKFDNVISNIELLIKTKQKLKSNNPQISLAAVAMANNIEEIPKLVILAKGLGIKNLRVGHFVPPTDDLKGPDYQKTMEIMEVTNELANDVNVEFEIRRGKRFIPHSCLLPFTSPYITVEGYVLPCCYSLPTPERETLIKKFSFGNLLQTDLSEVINSPKAVKFRKALLCNKRENLPDLCKQCFRILD